MVVTRTFAPVRARIGAASAALKRVLIGTRVAPASHRPSAAVIHRTPFGAQIATRSPASTPAATRAAPTVRASAASSA